MRTTKRHSRSFRVASRKQSHFWRPTPDAAFAAAETRELAVPLSPEGTARDGRTYLTRFGFPNFYFHLATGYNILRHNGVPLGKRDFLWAS
ncbi:DUF1993 family protein [Marivita sp.]|uniref:DUF1993 family protein n=1 Tax=Marivita sp. TaxID=2003365 RepID=UPI003A882180